MASIATMRFRPHHNLAVADCATNPLLRALLHFTAHLLHNRNRAATVLQAVPPSPCVVGYNLKTPTNFKFLGPNFIDCNGTEDITLADFNVNCDETDPDASSGWAANYDTVVLLDSAGNNIRNLVYIPQWLAEVYTDALEYSVTKGWYDIDTVGDDMHTNYNGVLIPAGEGFQVNASSGSADITVQIDPAL